MVIILQQATDNGKRFISTVVDSVTTATTTTTAVDHPHHSVSSVSTSNSGSLTSPNYISERSATYKQRIDSLFGRSVSRPEEPLSITKSVASSSRHEMGSKKQPVTTTGLTSSPLLRPGLKKVPTDCSDHDDDKHHEIRSVSGFTDSLNAAGNGRKQFEGSSPNVSSVRIMHIENANKQYARPGSLVAEEHVAYRRTENQILWRNGMYGECSRTSPPASITIPVIDKGFGQVKSSPGGALAFPVEYLGCVPVDGNTTALQDLQAPLKTLYYDFLSKKNVMMGVLSITTEGLKFEAQKVRLVNPFSTIAVWAAIKFVVRGDMGASECAFMPLISDPEGQDKGKLFTQMESKLSAAYHGCVGPKGPGSFKNPPVFACVMREASFTLDCHAFACKCAEDAIVVAANLYQSLVEKIRTVNHGSGGKEGESGYGSLTRINSKDSSPTGKSREDLTQSSSSSSPIEGCSSENISGSEPFGKSRDGVRVVCSDSESMIPIRPPRRKKKLYDVPLGNLKRYNSDESLLLRVPSKRRSLKGSGGYNDMYKHQKPVYSKVKKRVKITTPDETSSDSLNESIDHILDQIINPGGMSFNDLKPAYQKLLLKIALTLSQDQLYQKSKQAMKKHQQINMKRKGKHADGLTDAYNSSTGNADENFQFMNQFLKSFSKGRVNNPDGPLNRRGIISSPLLKSSRYEHLQLLPQPPTTRVPKVISKKQKKEDGEPFMSFCSGCVCDNCSEKCYCSLPSKNVKGANAGNTMTVSTSAGGDCTTVCSSEANTKSSCTSSYAVMNKDKNGNKVKRPCGYDTDSCAESEKCYCSLQRVKSNGLKIYNINLDTETSDTDTNSYDLEPFNPNEAETGSSSNIKTVSTRSVEILAYHPSKRGRSINGFSSTPVSSPDVSPPIQTTSALIHLPAGVENSSGKLMGCSSYVVNSV